MKLWWWRVRYAYWIWRGCRCNCAWDFAWECAMADESFNGPWTPRDAAESEMSYWDQDGLKL